MEDKSSDPVFPRKEEGAKGTADAALRLYRGNRVWRGAVDLALIGSLVLALSYGLFVAGPEPAAVFSEATDADSARRAPKSPFPEPADWVKDMTREWFEDMSAEDRKLVEQAQALAQNGEEGAIELLLPRAEAGDANFQTLLGIVYFDSALQNKTQEDVDRAVMFYKKAAAQNEPIAQFQLGRLYEKGYLDLAAQPDEAMKWYQAGADNPRSKGGGPEMYLARMYELGKSSAGVNMELAKKYYKIAAEKENPQAQAYFGAMAINSGKPDEGREWSVKAAQGGDSVAQINLALQYLYGGVTGKPDYTAFLKWAGLAADQGLDVAQLQLGHFYRRGEPGFAPEPKKAMDFYRRAADQNNAEAQFCLAEMLEKGEGGARDGARAYYYYLLALSNGNTLAYGPVAILEGRLTAGEIEEAKALSGKFLENRKDVAP